MAYKAKTLSGAQKRVRQLESRIVRLAAIHHRERVLLALLASGSHNFQSPYNEVAARKLRDSILRDIGRL